MEGDCNSILERNAAETVTILTSGLLSQVMLLISNNVFCIVQRATAQSKTGIHHGYGVADAFPIFSRLPQEQTPVFI
jgi:hypothetical protein